MSYVLEFNTEVITVKKVNVIFKYNCTSMIHFMTHAVTGEIEIEIILETMGMNK